MLVKDERGIDEHVWICCCLLCEESWSQEMWTSTWTSNDVDHRWFVCVTLCPRLRRWAGAWVKALELQAENGNGHVRHRHTAYGVLLLWCCDDFTDDFLKDSLTRCVTWGAKFHADSCVSFCSCACCRSPSPREVPAEYLGSDWPWVAVSVDKKWREATRSHKKPQEATRGQETPREDKVFRASMRHGSTWPILPDHPDLDWQSASSKLRQSAVASEPFWPLNSALVGTFRVSGSWRVNLALKLRTEQMPSSRCVLFAFCLRSPEVRPLNMLLCRSVTSIGIKRLYRSWKISQRFSHHIAFPAVSAATLISTSRTRKESRLLFCSPSKIWNPSSQGVRVWKMIKVNLPSLPEIQSLDVLRDDLRNAFQSRFAAQCTIFFGCRWMSLGLLHLLLNLMEPDFPGYFVWICFSWGAGTCLATDSHWHWITLCHLLFPALICSFGALDRKDPVKQQFPFYQNPELKDQWHPITLRVRYESAKSAMIGKYLDLLMWSLVQHGNRIAPEWHQNGSN